MTEQSITLTDEEVRTLLKYDLAELWRPMKPQPQRDNVGVWNWNGHCFVTVDAMDENARLLKYCSYGVRGDILYGLEAWREVKRYTVIYRAGENDPILDAYLDDQDVWQSSKNMPEWASRITMQIVKVLMDRRDGIWGWRLTVKHRDNEINRRYRDWLRNGGSAD